MTKSREGSFSYLVNISHSIWQTKPLCSRQFEIYLSPKYIQGFAGAQTVCNVHKSQAKCHFVCLIKAAWEFLGKHSRIAPLFYLMPRTTIFLLRGYISFFAPIGKITLHLQITIARYLKKFVNLNQFVVLKTFLSHPP